MNKLIKTEWIKIRTYPVFWLLTGLYVLLLVLVLLGFQGFIDNFFTNATKNATVPIPKISIYKFPDIWHNLTYIASARYFIKLILGVIMIILITNEYSYKTIRSNIISGMSRSDFVKSKYIFILYLSLLSTFAVFFIGLYMGFRYTDYVEIRDVFIKIDFLLAYFVELFSFLCFAFLIGLLVKRAGLAIGLIFIYTPIEDIIKFKVPEHIENFLPVQAMNHLIMTPNSKLMSIFGFKFQDHISITSLIVCLAYAGIFILISFLVINKKDL